MSDELLAAAKAVLNNIIASGSGPAAPTFDEFDAAVEAVRGRWSTVDQAALDRLQAAVEVAEGARGDADPGPELRPEQEALLAEVRRAWAASPELRLFQLLKNAVDRPEDHRIDGVAVFYYPDADLKERLVEWVAEQEEGDDGRR